MVRAKGEQVTPATLARSFSEADLDLARRAVLAACDADDGLRDGIVGAFRECTSTKVLPELKQLTCSGAKQDGCLIPAQVEALRRIHEGPHNSKGEPLYAEFPWDDGWAGRDWRGWKIGTTDGSMPSLNVAMGSIALAAVFSTPPAAPQDRLAYVLGFDFDRDAPKIYSIGGPFARLAWQDVGARSADLSAFSRRGGRMIVYLGALRSLDFFVACYRNR